jgi:hypothetical protein
VIPQTDHSIDIDVKHNDANNNKRERSTNTDRTNTQINKKMKVHIINDRTETQNRHVENLLDIEEKEELEETESEGEMNWDSEEDMDSRKSEWKVQRRNKDHQFVVEIFDEKEMITEHLEDEIRRDEAQKLTLKATELRGNDVKRF